MPVKKKDTLPKKTKKPAQKKIKVFSKKQISTPDAEEFKHWKDAKKVTLTYPELETMFDDAFDAADKIWIDTLTPLISRLNSICSDLSNLADEYRERDMHVKYTAYDKVRDCLICHLDWRE